MKAYTPHFTPSARLLRLLEEIGALRERVQNSLIKLPWVPSLVKEAGAKMAWGSTAIEGCTLSLEAVQALMEGKEAVGYPDKHINMARNYISALAWIQKREHTASITETDILTLHKIVSKNAVDEGPIGAYRKSNVTAGLYIAPDWQKVHHLMEQMVMWLNESAKSLPAVFSSSILHLRFIEIHPFRDGNGRVGRILATWELYRRGFDTLHIFALDEVLMENRSFYIKNLQRVQVEKDDLGGWLEFMAEAIIETLERVEKRITAIGPTGKKPLSLSVRQEKLLHLLREKGTLKIGDIANALKVTAPGAHYVLKPLLKHKLVKRTGTHKASRYTLA